MVVGPVLDVSLPWGGPACDVPAQGLEVAIAGKTEAYDFWCWAIDQALSMQRLVLLAVTALLVTSFWASVG